MPLNLEQRDLLAVVDRRSHEATKRYTFESEPAPVKAQLLGEMAETVFQLAAVIGGELNQDTQEALSLTQQATDAFLTAARQHAKEVTSE